MESWKDTKAVYRLLNEPDVTFDALMRPHWQQTRQHMESLPLVLLVQDTTDLDLSHRHQMSGLGEIGDGNGRGVYLQSVLAIDPETLAVLAAHVGLSPSTMTVETDLGQRLRAWEATWLDAVTGPPFWKTLWKGWLRLQALLEGVQ